MAQPSFSQWDFLDPNLMRATLATAHGSEVWTAADLLSSELMEAAVNALSSTPPFSPLVGIYDSRWTPGADNTASVDWSLADAIGSI
jgi:hypothetical protein